MFKKSYAGKSFFGLVATLLVASMMLTSVSTANVLYANESAAADLALMQSAFAQQFPGTSPSTAISAATEPKVNDNVDPSIPYLQKNPKLFKFFFFSLIHRISDFLRKTS